MWKNFESKHKITTNYFNFKTKICIFKYLNKQYHLNNWETFPKVKNFRKGLTRRTKEYLEKIILVDYTYTVNYLKI